MSNYKDFVTGMELCLASYGRGWTSRSPIEALDVGATVCLSCMRVHVNPLVTQQTFVHACRECAPDKTEIPRLQVELDDLYVSQTGLNPYTLYGVLYMLNLLTTRNRDIILPSGAVLGYTTFFS